MTETYWHPMETAPKDRHITALVNGVERIVRWGKTSHLPWYGFCLADQGIEDFDICEPTGWRDAATQAQPATIENVIEGIIRPFTNLTNSPEEKP